jgi:acetolactate synthase-1/2/3 large subunit
MVVVVGNDSSWGQIHIPQRSMHGERYAVATRLAPTRYDRIVEAMGGRGEHVEDPADLEPALERAFASGAVYCVDVAIDPEAAASSGAAGYAV